MSYYLELIILLFLFPFEKWDNKTLHSLDRSIGLFGLYHHGKIIMVRMP